MPRSDSMTDDAAAVPEPDADAIVSFLRDAGLGWLRVPNIVGVSVGRKRRDGKEVGELAIIFDVVAKLDVKPAIVRAGSRPIPPAIAIGDHLLPTDVVEGWPKPNAVPLERRDPLPGGVSIGGRAETGTLGAVVRHLPTGKAVALSNWHVLVNGNDDGATFQPGPFDVPASGKTALGRVLDGSVLDGLLDAAVTTIAGRRADADIAALGVSVRKVAAPAEGMHVVKSGRTTGTTRGIVRKPKALGVPFFGFAAPQPMVVHVVAPLEGEESAPLAAQGDSGACWMLEDEGRPTDTMVGLHIASDDVLNLAYFCAADAVFERLKLAPLDAAALPLTAMTEALAAPRPSAPYRVIARSLRVRAGPGTTFPRLDARQHGDIVHVIGASDDWLMVDLHGDGKADGYMFGGLLEPVVTS